MNIRMEVDTSKLNLDADKINKAVSQEIEKTAHRIERQAKELAPVDTGELRRSITTEGSGLDYEIGTNLEYSEYIEDGTSPHIINGNPYLYWEGASHPVRRVNHPGNKAYLYMETACDTQTEDIEDRIADIIDKLL